MMVSQHDAGQDFAQGDTTRRLPDLLHGTLRMVTIGMLLLRQYWALRRFRKMADGDRQRHRAIPRQFVQTLLDLGPLFVKIGQILSTRPDVLPKEYVAELARLQEHVPPVSFDQVQATIKDQFHQEIDELFASIESEPVAAASLAQVHLAMLHDDTPVAVKVQRSLVRDRIDSDLQLVAAVVRLFSWFFPKKARRLNLVAGFTEFRALEARTIERFRRNFAGRHEVIIPQVYEQLVTPKVLTMQRVAGLRLAEIAPRLSAAERTRLSHRLMEIEMKMFISDGLFHANLHPGNILFEEDGTIALLDFGMYGELSDAHRDHFILYWLAAAQRQTQRAFTHLIAQTTCLPRADEQAYYRTFEGLAERFYASTISEQSLTQTYLDIILSGARFGFVFPSDLLLHAKALTTAEALAFTLTPDLRFEREVRPIIVRLCAKRLLDVGRLQALAARVLPELLLLGELPPITAAIETDTNDSAYRLGWGEALIAAARELAQAFQPSVDELRSVLAPATRAVLVRVYSEGEVDDLLDDIWARYADRAATLPPQAAVGPRIMVHLSAATVAAYETLVSAGRSEAEATALIYAIAWRVYTKMGEVPWAIAELVSPTALEKLRFATAAFRSFPFSAPSYRWQDVDAGPRVVAFNCLKCPVAEYFRSQYLSYLCVNTWCQLDYPLAQQWGAELRRTGTIASGAPVCDFRWHLRPGSAEMNPAQLITTVDDHEAWTDGHNGGMEGS